MDEATGKDVEYPPGSGRVAFYDAVEVVQMGALMTAAREEDLGTPDEDDSIVLRQMGVIQDLKIEFGIHLLGSYREMGEPRPGDVLVDVDGIHYIE